MVFSFEQEALHNCMRPKEQELEASLVEEQKPLKLRVQDIFWVPNFDKDDRSSRIAKHVIDRAVLETRKNQKAVLAEVPWCHHQFLSAASAAVVSFALSDRTLGRVICVHR